MGFLSADCIGCGHPLLNTYRVNSINDWMNIGVAIYPDGTIRTGSYDGYGNLDQRLDSPAVGHDTTVWHESCWIVAGEPTDYRGPSKSSQDQGWFFEDGAHDMPDPLLEDARYELLLVTGDGCDAVSSMHDTYDDAVRDLREICKVLSAEHRIAVSATVPIDGHGILYSIETAGEKPELWVHHRYHIGRDAK